MRIDAFCMTGTKPTVSAAAKINPANSGKQLLLTAAVLLTGADLLAQLPGTVHFANQTSSLVVNGQTGHPVVPADGVRAGLYWAPLGSSGFTQLGGSVNVGTPAAGIYFGGTRTTGTQTPAGSSAQFCVRAWGGGYATYESALTHSGVLIGQSPVFTNRTGTPKGGTPFPPYPLAAGGASSFTLTTNIVAAQPPNITCAPNKTVQCTDTWTFDPPTALDGCTAASLPIWVLATQTNYFGCSNLVMRTWVATNSCNRLYSTCSQSATVLFNQPPAFNCPAAKTVACTNAWTFDTPTAFDSCSGSNLVVIPLGTTTNFLGCSNIVVQTWTATNTCNGVSSTCIQAVSVLFNQPPVFNCPAAKAVACTNVWTFDTPTAFDSCSGSNLVVSPLGTTTNFFGCSNVVVQTWTATNACNGLSSTCSQSVTVLFDQPPGFNCPAAKTVSCTNLWGFDTPTAFDSCSGSNLVVSPVGTTTNFFGCSNVVVQTWTATNACNGLSSTCSQSVTLLFDQPPGFNSPAAKTVSCTNLWGFDTPTAFDSCSGSNLTVVPLGTMTNFFGCSNVVIQTWTATNSCNGVSSTCSQAVTVLGITPTIVCPDNLVLSTCDTNVIVTWTLMATDTCSAVTVTSTPPSGTSFLPNTTNTVLCTASDGCGNTNMCTFTVTVLRPTLGAVTITRSGGSVTLHWTDGILQQSTNVLGPWADVPGAASPSYTVTPNGQAFYRLRCNSP